MVRMVRWLSVTMARPLHWWRISSRIGATGQEALEAVARVRSRRHHKRNELPFAAVLDPGSAVFRDTHMVARRLIMPRLILDKKSEAASSAETGQLYAVRLDSWDANSRFHG